MSSMKRRGDCISLFEQSRLIRPRLRQLEPYPPVVKHLEAMGCAEYFIPALQSPTAITRTELIRCYLAMSPLVVTRVDGNMCRWQVVANVTGFNLARMHLGAGETIPALVIATPSFLELEQILAHDAIVNSVLELSIKRKGSLWEYKTFLEKAGGLASVGLAGHSRDTWAKWLRCDPRSLRAK